MHNMICLTTGNELQQDETAQYIDCDISCRYFDACNDDFNKAVAAKAKANGTSTKTKSRTKAIYEDMPEENESTGPANIDDSGFQQSMEEDEIVEAMKLTEDKEGSNLETEAAKSKTTKPKTATSKPKTTKPKTAKPKKPSNSVSLDDIEL